MEYIKRYIEDWESVVGVKPVNDNRFIAEFTRFMEDSDYDHWEFDGENGYCGYTAILHEHPQYIPVRGLRFEFAYGDEFVKAFNANHGGFWVPEYIDLKGQDAEYLLLVIKKKLNGWAGFRLEAKNG